MTEDQDYETRARIVCDILNERQRQHAKWGDQSHLPNGTSSSGHLLANVMRSKCQAAMDDGTVTWQHILLEEVYEAIAEWDVDKLRNELVQVAAVTLQWLEAIERRRPRMSGISDRTMFGPTFRLMLGTRHQQVHQALKAQADSLQLSDKELDAWWSGAHTALAVWIEDQNKLTEELADARSKIDAINELAGEHWDWKAGQTLSHKLRAILDGRPIEENGATL